MQRGFVLSFYGGRTAVARTVKVFQRNCEPPVLVERTVPKCHRHDTGRFAA
jgi:hypothetical protein